MRNACITVQLFTWGCIFRFFHVAWGGSYPDACVHPGRNFLARWRDGCQQKSVSFLSVNCFFHCYIILFFGDYWICLICLAFYDPRPVMFEQLVSLPWSSDQ